MTPARLDTAPDVAALVRQLHAQPGLPRRQLSERGGLMVNAPARLQRAQTADVSLGRTLRLVRALGMLVRAVPTLPRPSLTARLHDVREVRTTGQRLR